MTRRGTRISTITAVSLDPLEAGSGRGMFPPDAVLAVGKGMSSWLEKPAPAVTDSADVEPALELPAVVDLAVCELCRGVAPVKDGWEIEEAGEGEGVCPLEGVKEV